MSETTVPVSSVPPAGGGLPLNRLPEGKRRKAAVPLPANWQPPHSIEAERAVLGSMLLAGREGADLAAELLKEEMFYDPKHASMFGAASQLLGASQPLDTMTLRQRLSDLKQFDLIGGDAYLADVISSVATPSNIRSYAEIVRDKFLLRRTMQACADVVHSIHESPDDPKPVLDQAQASFFEITDDSSSRESQPVGDLIRPTIEYLEERRRNRGTIMGVATGFADLDSLTGGLRPGQMVVFAARPGVGKTSFALNIAEHAVLEAKKRVAFFSLEMTNEELMVRLLAARAEVNSKSMQRGFTNEHEDRKIHDAAAEYHDFGRSLLLDDSAGVTITQIRTKARRLKRRFDIDLVVIDYLQLIRGSSSNKNDSRQNEVAEISGGVKAMAKELRIPVIVLCQLNRESEKGGENKTPRISQLRESGAIEQDADIVGMVVRPSMHGDPETGAEPPPVESDAYLDIQKHRNGETRRINLTFYRQFTKFATPARKGDVAYEEGLSAEGE